MLTLSDRKVYVGKVISLGEPTETNGTKIDVSLTVEFNSILHAAVFDLQIEQVVRDVLSSFRDRINTRQR